MIAPALQVRYRRHAVGMHLAALVDRDILADDKAFVGEMITGFVGQIGIVVIVEAPGTACVVDKMAKPICFVGTLPRDPAGLAMRPPKLRIDASFGIDRCGEDIRHFVVAIGCPGSRASTMRICRNWRGR